VEVEALCRLLRHHQISRTSVEARELRDGGRGQSYWLERDIHAKARPVNVKAMMVLARLD
jgi:hypothetical protein